MLFLRYMAGKRHIVALHHRHANSEGVVDTVTQQVEADALEAALGHANTLIANALCRNFGCRIELDGSTIVYTLVRDNSRELGPVRFCRQDAQALAQARNATLAFETAWRVDRALQPTVRLPSSKPRSLPK